MVCPRLQRTHLATLAVAILASATLGAFCDKPDTNVVLENRYPRSASALVIYRASYKEVSFEDAVLPGGSSDPQTVVAASPNPAFVLLAPGWDPSSGATPTSLVVMQSKDGFAVHFDTTLRIGVDDATFVGNCAAGSRLTQSQADFITQLVFPDVFASLAYDATTCTTRPIGDARAD